MTPQCKCGHPRSLHNPHSENYDAPLECDDPDCWCDDYDRDVDAPPEEDVEIED
jgi:hypothetical protein